MNKKLKTLLYSNDPINVKLGITILNNDPDIEDLMSMMVKYYQPIHQSHEHVSIYTFDNVFRIVIDHFYDAVEIHVMKHTPSIMGWCRKHYYFNVTGCKEHYLNHPKSKTECNIWKEVFMAQFAVDKFQELADSGKLFN